MLFFSRAVTRGNQNWEDERREKRTHQTMKRMKDIKPRHVPAPLFIPVLLNVFHLWPGGERFLLGDEHVSAVGEVIPVPIDLRVQDGVAHVEDGIGVGDEHGPVGVEGGAACESGLRGVDVFSRRDC